MCTKIRLKNVGLYPARENGTRGYAVLYFTGGPGDKKQQQ